MHGPQRQLRKETLFVQSEKKQNSALFRISYQSNPFLMGRRSYIHSLLQVLSKVTVMMHGNLLHATV